MRAWAALLLLAGSAAAEPPPPPRAPVRPVSDVYFGTTVVDPNRWLEDGSSPEVRAWIRAQDGYARAVLAAIPGRDALRARVDALSGGDAAVTRVRRAGGRLFYLLRGVGADSYRLVVRDGAGPERVLVDPEKLATGGAHMSIDYYAPSLDGKLVAYGVSPGGSEDSVLRVVEVDGGRDHGDRIDRAQNASPSWLPDGRSFTYTRLQKVEPGMPETARYQKSRAYLHVVGRDPERDPALFGWGVDPAIPVDENDTCELRYVDGAPWLFAGIAHGARNEITLWATPLAGAPAWRRVVDLADEVTDFTAHGDDVYVLSHRVAPRFKLLRLSLGHPEAAPQIVMATGQPVLETVVAAADALYVRALDGGPSRLWRVPYSGSAAEVRLPFTGAVSNLAAAGDGATFALQGWTHAPAYYEVAAGAPRPLALVPPPRVDFSRIESEEVVVPSRDGTMVPLSIVHARGLARDGRNPTLLYGYGAYGVALEPFFQPAALAWLERGGVYAVAHVRGGGELGEDWHRGGMKQTKQRTIDDFVAAAEWLVQHKITRPEHLAGMGVSAGGITIAGAITERPDLFGAAVIRVGDSDILRTEFATDGPGNAAEYGTVKVKEEFEVMRKISGYHRVRDGVKYPAVLLIGGANDARVALYQSTKMAARLQAATASGKPILLRVDFDSGHGMGMTRAQAAAELADTYAFLLWQLGGATPGASRGR